MIMASKVEESIILIAKVERKSMFLLIKYIPKSMDYIVDEILGDTTETSFENFIKNLSHTFMNVKDLEIMITVMHTETLSDRFRLEEVKEIY